MWRRVQFGICGWFGRYSFGCQPVDYSSSAMAIRVSIDSLAISHRFLASAIAKRSSFVAVFCTHLE